MVLVAGIRLEVRPGGVVSAAGTVRAGTWAAAGKTARAAGYVQGAFARAREVWGA